MSIRLFALAAALVAALWASPAAALDSSCPDAGGTQYLVNTPAEAALIADGYSNTACDVVVTTSIAPAVQKWALRAKSFTINSASIINALPLSAIAITTNEDIAILNGVLKAREDLQLRCLTAGCEMTSTAGSVILASETLDPFAIPGDPNSGPATKGKLFVSALGPINFVAETFYGGSRVEVFGSAVVVKITGQVGPCQCGGGKGGGGLQEFRVTAKTGDIDISGSSFVFLSHATFEAKQGKVIADNTVLSSITDLQIIGFDGVSLKGATWSAGKTVRVESGGGCPALAECVSAQESKVSGGIGVVVLTAQNKGLIDVCGSIQDRLSGGLPSLNGKASFPYPVSVIARVVECLLEGLGPAVINGQIQP